MHPADRLLAAIERSAPVCVGLDPVVDRLPDSVAPRDVSPEAIADAFTDFGREVLDAVADHVPCVKLQSACFERYGAPGLASRDALCAAAAERNLIVILDAKRGDIGISARHYAAAADLAGADWLTVNPYLGPETISPFLESGRGAFALVRTSNPDSDQIQQLELADGRTVAEAVADVIAALGATTIGSAGYSALGAVIGATWPEQATRLRQRMPHQLFLVPGYGAQGGGADDVLPCFNADGRGAIVTASRSVLYPDDPGPWTDAIREAARRLAGEVGEAVRRRSGTMSEH